MLPLAISPSPSLNLTPNDISDWTDGDWGGVLAFLEGVRLAASKHDLGRCDSRGRGGEVHQVRAKLEKPCQYWGLGEGGSILDRYQI